MIHAPKDKQNIIENPKNLKIQDYFAPDRQ